MPLVDLSAELDVVAGRAIEPRSERREPQPTGVPVPPAEPTMRVPSARPFSKAPTPRPVVEPEADEEAPRRRWGWLIAALIILAAAAVAAAIGLSGPSVPGAHDQAGTKSSGGSASPP